MLDTLCAVLTGFLASKRGNTACTPRSVFCPLQNTAAVIEAMNVLQGKFARTLSVVTGPETVEKVTDVTHVRPS